MNSLSTTVGGEVINEDDINISSNSRQRTKKPPLMLRGSTTGGHRTEVHRNQMKSIDSKNDVSPRVRATRSNLPRASLNRHRSAPVSDNNASSNFSSSSSRIMRRNRGLSISEKSNTEESVDDVNSRLRSSLLQSMSNLSSRSTATPPFDNRNNYTSSTAVVVVDNDNNF